MTAWRVGAWKLGAWRGTAWAVNAPTPPTPAPSTGGGGGWYGPHSYKRKRLRQNIDQWVDEMYAEIVAADLPKAIKQEAGKIVRPFVDERRQKIPEPEKVDWAALRSEASAIRSLYELWVRVMDEEEEEEILFLMMH